MKFLPLLFLLSLAFLPKAHAQISLTLEGGANYGRTEVNENMLFETENILGYYLAVTPKFSLTNRLRVFAEFQYSLEGAESVFFTNVASESLSYRNHLVRLIPGLEVKVFGPLRLIGGVNVGYVAVESAQNTATTALVNGGVQLLKTVDYGVLAGANYKIGSINLSLKYNLGLRDINNINFTDIDGNIIDGLKLRSRFIQLGIGYELGS